MEYKVLLRAGLKRHKGTIFGIFLLTAAVSFALASALSLWLNSERYVNQELKRAGYGDLTIWVSDVPEGVDGAKGEALLAREIENLPEVERVTVQEMVFSDYEIHGEKSDSEGQLILFWPDEHRYRFFDRDLKKYVEDVPEIGAGEVYVSPSLVSMFGVSAGDRVTFSIARGGKTREFVIKGFYEDPFMGSSMIGMKGFLVCEEDLNRIREEIREAEIDALARTGAMLHVTAGELSASESSVKEASGGVFSGGISSGLTASDLSRIIGEQTMASSFMEFAHSAGAISGFMLVLQTAYCGLFLAFVLILLVVVLVVLGHSIGGAIEAEWKEFGIYKALGFTVGKLRRVMAVQYLSGVVLGMGAGAALAGAFSGVLGRATLTTTGILVPGGLVAGPCGAVYVVMLGLLFVFITIKTGMIGPISPMEAVRGERGKKGGLVSLPVRETFPAIREKRLYLSLAMRQLAAGRRRFLAAGITAMVLVFMASLVGHMNTWLGEDGKGMMDAFNPADHDLGVQVLGDLEMEELVDVVESVTDITDRYELAMPDVSVEGSVYTANVITEPERFHILSGRTCAGEDEIVVTDTVSGDLGIGIGSMVTVRGDLGSDVYRVAGIYQCANDMGANIGMSREGYLKIGHDEERLWCSHLFLSDPSRKGETKEALEMYGGDVHVHENSWPGLLGIIAAMKVLLMVLYLGVAGFVFVVTVMTGSKVLRAEERELGIYKAIGFEDRKLRCIFTFRFVTAAGIGGCLGAVGAALGTDVLVGAVMRFAGISDFVSKATLGNTAVPLLIVAALFGGAAWVLSGKIRRVELTALMNGG